MSLLLEFPPSGPLPGGVNSPPYVVFGINGADVTSSLPPFIPLRLVLHFTPTLQKWVLPAPDPTYLPRPDAEEAVRTPHVGINIVASIEAEGLTWIIMRMLHLSGRKASKETFSLHPDLSTSLAIHKAWLALELRKEGLLGLHNHIHAQLLLSSTPVCILDMRMLWDTFPHSSGIVWAMGLNFMEGLVGQEYSVPEILEIMTWLQSTPELSAFSKALQAAKPAYKDMFELRAAAEEKEKTVGTGHQTVGKRAGKATKVAVADNAGAHIMERGATRKVSLKERHERETSDFRAMQTRLKRTKSDDSVRSVKTAILNPQHTEDEAEIEGKEGARVNDDMHNPNNYSGASFSAELARSLELIKLRREVRRLEDTFSNEPLVQQLTSANFERHSTADAPIPRSSTPILRHRRPSSTTTTGRGGLIADLEVRIQALQEKQEQLKRNEEERDTDNDEGEPDTQVGRFKLADGMG